VRELKETNAYLGDRAALNQILQDQGYWFFKGVLDHGAVSEMRKHYNEVLKQWDLVKADEAEPVWNGGSLADIGDGLNNSRIPELREKEVWETFVKNPKVNAFFESILGSPLEWITASDFYRLVPPTQNVPEDPYKGRHQDGLGLQGLDFLTCWIPLNTIDADCGGLAIATGSYSGSLYHDRWFDPELVKPDGWARSDYHLGDVLMFLPTMMHSGLPNLSDRFRLSLDIRVLRPESARPIYGKVIEIDNQQVTIQNHDGKTGTYRYQPSSHLRGMKADSDIPILVSADEVPSYLPPGSEVLATSKDGEILVLRPNQY